MHFLLLKKYYCCHNKRYFQTETIDQVQYYGGAGQGLEPQNMHDSIDHGEIFIKCAEITEQKR